VKQGTCSLVVWVERSTILASTVSVASAGYREPTITKLVDTGAVVRGGSMRYCAGRWSQAAIVVY